jgi:aldehyde:ferredoxin oxidoreductase
VAEAPCGYAGRILRVDLGERRFAIERLDPRWIKDVVGGRAANTKRLVEDLQPDADPLGPANVLIFGVGPLTGTLLPASAYYTVTARSPLTGILGDSAAGGHFGPEMKLAGFDQIVVTGCADALSYLLITEDGVKFVPCPELAGRNVVETTAAIREAHADWDIQVAAIGIAGENKVRFAALVSSGNRVNGRAGMGAVMGSKNLKAIAVRGSHPIRLHDPLRFLDEVRKVHRGILEHPEYEKRRRLGTTMLMQDLNRIGILPTRHFQEGLCSYVDEVSGEALAARYKVKNKSCYNCHVHCSRYYVCDGLEAEGPEFETLCGFTSRIGNRSLAFALEMNRTLNQYGMDSLAVCEIVGWLMECQEKGLVTPDDVDGMRVSWGDCESVRHLVDLIAHRQGIGDALAEGATRFSRRFSEAAQKLVMQVKGLDIICGDPRGIKGYGLTYAVASRGADHLRAEPYFELTERWEIARQRFGTEKAADRLSEEGKAALVTYSEKIALLTDSLTMCKNVGLCMDVITIDSAAALLAAATGARYTPERLEAHFGDAVRRDLEFNRRCGITRADDTLPDRFLHEPLADGPTRGSTVDLPRMLDEYYRLHEQ